MTAPLAYEHAASPDAKFAKGKGSTRKITIVVLNCEDPDTAVAQAEAETEQNLTQDGVALVRRELKPTRKSDTIWLVDVDYAEEDSEDEKNNERPEPGTWRFSFDGQQGTHTIQQALETVSSHSWSMSEEAPNHNKVIGWDGEDIKGCEIVVPSFEFTITAYYDPQEVTVTRALNWASMRGRINGDGWLGQKAGEFLYLGPAGSGDIPTVAGQRTKPVEVTHKFSYSPQQEDLQLGNGLVVELKKGWDHLWVFYRKQDDGTHLLPKPVFAYVEKVYKDLTFGAFFSEIAGSDPPPGP